LLAFLVPLDSDAPEEVYHRLRREVELYSRALYHRPHVLVFTKRDLLPPDAAAPVIQSDALAVQVISSASGHGVDELKELLWRLVQEQRAAEVSTPGEDADEFE
jgi:GTP-binding protein